MAYETKGKSARCLVSIGAARAAKASSEGWCLRLRPNSQDAQLEQIREVLARLDEEAGQLVQLRQNIGQEWAGRAPAGEARHQAQDVQHRIADDARARLPPASCGVGQNLATAAMLLRAMPEPSTIEGRRIQESSRISWKTPRSDGPRALPPKAGVPSGASRRDFSVHAGSLGPHRAYAEHRA
jgi:hypothetical protein